MSGSSILEHPRTEHVAEIAVLVAVELQTILASRTFARAARLSALLSYVVENTLAKRADDLTEQQIGIHVFGRTAGFNTAEDTIVRGTARLLRQRLETYYRDEGGSAQIRITIPKGSYIARFESGEQPSQTAAKTEAIAATSTPAIPQQSTPASWPVAAKLSLAVLLLCVAALGTLLLLHKPDRAPVLLSSEPQALWNVLFTSGRKTLIVPGDASLDAYTAWEQQPVSLGEYSNQSYLATARRSLPPGGNDVPLAVRSVTPMADLRLVAELVLVPEHMAQPALQPWVEIRYARDVVVGETHDNNLILIGSETFNPWVTLYRNSMDFYALHDLKTDVFTIENHAPRPGEASLYRYARAPQSDTYTHLALLDNAQGSGKVLIIEGTSMGTTYAALTFLTQERLWRPVVEAATDQHGRLHNFEVLLASEFIRGGLTNTHRIALHVH